MPEASVIFGLDILARSNRSSKGSIFSLVVLTQEHLDKYPKITRKTLFNKIEDLKPDYIAMDNIFELSPGAKGITRFLQKIPPQTMLVQVTGSPRTGMEKITTLIRKHRLKKEFSFSSSFQKMNSLETAEVCARLCQKHIGHEILAFEEEIRIRVSKKKSHGRGGWSAPRYERISRAAVAQAGNEVESILRGKSVTWEVFEYPQRRVFIAQLEKKLISEIQVLIKPLTTELVRVTLERISKSNLDFQPLDVNIAPASLSLKNIILGIDPGTTTGMAVIDLMKGNLLYLNSKRECGISTIIRTASKFGKICCVAADVIPIPATVEKIGKITGAKLMSPTVLVSAAAKREYLHDYRDKTVNYGHLNSHERDALFGAIKAFNSMKEQLSKINQIVRYSYPELIPKLPEIQRLVISGNSISNAIEMMRGKFRVQSLIAEEEPNQLTISLKHENEILQAKIEAIYEEMDKLDQEAIFWRKQAQGKTVKLKDWKDKYERERLKRSNLMQKRISAAVEREVGRIREENQKIRRTLRQNQHEMEKLKQIRNFWVQGREIPLKVMKSFTDSAIRETEEKYGLNDGDIVLILDPSGGGAQTAQKMIDIGVRSVIIPEDSAKFSDQAIGQFEDNCVPYFYLPLMDFSVRIENLNNQPNLEIWVYDELYLTDIGIKEEIRKKELKLREKLRKRRMTLMSKAKKSSKVQMNTEVDIEKLLTDFKEDYIAQHQSDYEEKLEDSPEEE